MTMIYKISPRPAWEAAKAAGVFTGAPIDLADGYIHFSAAHQVRETAAKHFTGQADLMLVAIDAEALGGALKWEASRGGDLFPHLYADLSMSAVRAEFPMLLGPDGQHILPPEIQ
jgi:uncharacterized protein (DUF952 family)